VSRRRLALIGSGGLGRETLWALQAAGACERNEVVGFVTCLEAEHGTEVCGVPVLGPEDWLIGQDVEAVCCIGDPRSRRAVAERLEGRGVAFATVVHPSAEMSDHVEIREGCIVGARAVLTSQVEVGPHVVIGVGTIVSHDCRVEAFATLGPGALLAGGVTVEHGAELGAGATVLPGRKVGRGALVGAQCAVTEDVAPNTVVAGVPGKSIRSFGVEESL